MKFNDGQQIRICEIAEAIYWQAVNDSGGLFVEEASDLAAINTKVYEQGKMLLRYLEDITLEPEIKIKEKKNEKGK